MRQILLAALLLACAAPAAAQQRPDLTELDMDRDGKVSRADYKAAVLKELIKYDKNRDGRVLRTELPALAKLPGMRGQVDRIWKTYDHSGDGVVTRDEVSAQAERRFGELDTDKDGVFSQAEADAAAAAARKAR